MNITRDFFKVILIKFTMERERSFKKKLPLKRSSDTRSQGSHLKWQGSDISNHHWRMNNPNLQQRMDNYKGTGAKKIG